MDLCAEAITLLLKFADDTKGMQEISNYDDRDNLQQALDNMVKWAETWGMKIMHVGKRNLGYEYKMAGTRLAEVEEEKDIGVTVQKNMKPSKQCKNAAGITGAVSRQLARNFHFRDRFVFKKLYVKYVRPHLEFASPAWSPWLQEDIEILEAVQKKAIGMISGLKSKSYGKKCEEIGLESLKARSEWQDLLEAYKIIHGPERKRGEVKSGNTCENYSPGRSCYP